MPADWNIAAPPSPTGYDNFPVRSTPHTDVAWAIISRTPMYVLGSGVVPGVFWVKTLVVSRWWESVCRFTAVPGAGSQGYAVAITTGVDVSDTDTQGFGESLGLEAGFDLDGLSDKVTSTVSYDEEHSHTVAFEDATTKTSTFSVDNPPGKVAVDCWQLMEELRIELSMVGVPGGTGPGKVVMNRLTNPMARFQNTKYPPDLGQRVELVRR